MLPSHIDCGDKSIVDKLEEIRNGNGGEWAIWNVQNKTAKLVLHEEGEGVSDFVDEFLSGKVQFAYLCYNMEQTKRFLVVSFCGESSPDQFKNKFPNYARDWEDFLKKNNYAISVNLMCRKEDDISEDIIVNKLNKSTNTFVRATKTNEQKIDLSSQKKNFWQQQTQKDAAFKEEQERVRKQKEQELLDSRKREAERRAAETNANLAKIEQSRQEKVQRHQEEQRQRDAQEHARFEQQESQFRENMKQRDAAIDARVNEQKQQKVGGNVSAARDMFNNLGKKQEEPAPRPAPKRTYAYQNKQAAAPKQPEPEPEPQYEEQQYEEPAQEEQQYQEEYQEEQPQQEEQYQEPEPEPQYEEPQQEEQQYEEPAQEEQPQQEKKLYVAQYDYDAQQDGDLSFRTGDVIEIIDDSDPDGWWKGLLNGEEGVVPANYLEPY